MDEQQEEKAAIMAIFASGFEDLSANEFKFRVPINAFDNAFLVFHVRFSRDYPASDLDVLDLTSEGLDEELQNSIVRYIYANKDPLIGAPFLFALTGLIEEAIAGSTAIPPQEYCDAPEKQPMQHVEEKINYGLLPGEPVTKDSFGSWWDAFRKQHGVVLETDPEYQTEHNLLRPSGKEIWMAKIGAGEIED